MDDKDKKKSKSSLTSKTGDEQNNIKNSNSETKTGPEQKLLQGKVWKLAFSLAIPVILLELVETLFIIIDKIMAVQLTNQPGGAYYENGVDPAAAMSLISPVIMLSAAILILFSAGGSILYSMNLGQQKFVEARKAKGNAMIMSIIVSSASIASAIIFGPIIFNFILGTTGQSNAVTWTLDNESIGSAAYIYLLVYSLSFPFTVVLGSIYSGLNSEGKIMVPSIISIASLPINIILDYIFMSPDFLGWGTGGAALATVIADAFILIFLGIYTAKLKRKKDTYMFAAKSDFKLDSKVVRNVAGFGFPMTVNFLVSGLVAFASFKAFLFIGTVPESSFNYLMELGIDTDTTNNSLDLLLPYIDPNTLEIDNSTMVNVTIENAAQYRSSPYYDYLSSFATATLLNSSNSYASVNSFRRFASLGFVYGSMNLVTMNYAAKKYDRVKSTISFQLLFCLLSLAIGTVVMYEYSSFLIDLLSNTWDAYETDPIFVIHDSQAFRSTIINSYNAMLISGLFLTFSTIPYMLLNSTRKRGPAVVWIVGKGFIIYIFMYLPLMYFISRLGNVELALWLRAILEGGFFVYALIYLIIFVSNIQNPDHHMWDARMLSKWNAKRGINTIPSAAKLELIHLIMVGSKYNATYIKNIEAIEKANPVNIEKAKLEELVASKKQSEKDNIAKSQNEK